MPHRLRNIFLFVWLLAAAIATWLLRPPAPPENVNAGATATQRGFYMLDAVFSGLDETGEIIYRLAATRIEGSQRSEQMQFHDVEISYGQDQGIPWQISAQSARTHENGSVLELTNVIIESLSDSADETTRIEAATLELEPDRQLASTAGPVRLAIGDSAIDAVGLTADLLNERIHLESSVSGRVSP